jgi:hypothetical protein
LLVACSGSDDDKAAAVPTAAIGPAATVAELTALAEQVFPKNLPPIIGHSTCDSGFAGTRGFDACPFTTRLKQRLATYADIPANPVCRCQNFSDDRVIKADLTPAGGVAHVEMFAGSSKIDLIIVRSEGKLLVDDTACTGKPGTSIYTTMSSCS